MESSNQININKRRYKLYERYVKELSDNPYNSNRYGEKCKLYCSKYGCTFFPFLKSGTSEIKGAPYWVMSDNDVSKVVKFMNANPDLGFIGLSPSVLHDTWEFFMLPHLYALWCKFLYGDDENIIPDLENFCLLVRGQTRGDRSEIARIIMQVLLEKGYTVPKKMDKKCNNESLKVTVENKVTKYAVIRYFYDLTASYLYGLGRSHNPEYLLWESCYAGLNEMHLRVSMQYYAEKMDYWCKEKDIESLLNTTSFLRTILNSAVSMMFGSSYTMNLVPFLHTPRATILDVSQAMFLTTFLKRDEDISFEIELVYSQNLDGINFTSLHEVISRQGPTFVIVKDEEGYVFGGYASVSWAVTPNFIGDDQCFLFRLLPNAVICKASKLNNNFMYLNYPRTETQEDGLGMGGRMKHFGLWIDLKSEYGKCAHACDTFDDFVCLSHNTNFIYVQLEVWRVEKRGQPQERLQSILPKLATEKSDALEHLKGDYENIIDKISNLLHAEYEEEKKSRTEIL